MNLRIYENRKKFYIVSIVLLLCGIVSLLVQGLNLGIDFQSGTLMDIKFHDGGISIAQVRSSLSAYGLENSNITQDGEGTYIIKSLELSEETQNAILQAFRDGLGGFDLKRIESVGPIVGRELARNGIVALIVASALVLVYISIRFQWEYAVSAVACLVHDCLIMLGIFSICQFEVESSFIAAILTVIGYSINNTIVIFDRIRENRRLHAKWKGEEMVNNSVNQTMVRTINLTMGFTLVLGSLIFLGGETTRVFAIALFIGNLAGFYSSAFISANLWMDFRPKGIKA